MKIAVFIPSLAGGGAERVAVTLANEFALLGHTTHLLVATNASSAYRAEVIDSVTLHFFNTSRTLQCVFDLVKFIKNHKPTALLSIMDRASIVAYLAYLVSGERNNTRFFAREAVSLEYKQAQFTGLRGKIRRTLKDKLTCYVYRAADGVISPSTVLAQSIATRYGPQVNVTHIDNPVVTADFEQRSTCDQVSLPWKNNHKLIVGAARFTAQKNFMCLLKAFKILRLNVDCKLILLGEGPERGSLENFIDENNLSHHCYLPGFVSNPLPYFVAADVFVLSSSYEGSPNVLIQALACGANVVSTDCPTGPVEILINEQYGRLVPVGNEKEMANAIEKTLSAPDENKQHLTQTIRTKYDSKLIAAQYLSTIMPGAESQTNTL